VAPPFAVQLVASICTNFPRIRALHKDVVDVVFCLQTCQTLS
jgi:hypothetical protein